MIRPTCQYCTLDAMWRVLPWPAAWYEGDIYLIEECANCKARAIWRKGRIEAEWEAGHV